MITEAFRKKFKRTLGEMFSYTPPVKRVLQDDLHATNRDGNSFSSQSIRNVFHGNRENETIETAILVVYQREIEKKYRIQSLKSSLGIEESNKFKTQ